MWEHLFVTAQGSAYARFRRALDSRNATVAFASATELDFVSLPDALELVLLVVDDPRRFRRAALRWHARYCGEVPDVASRKPRPCSPASPV
jgi:DNA-binding FadR family transcriptional regulator